MSILTSIFIKTNVVSSIVNISFWKPIYFFPKLKLVSFSSFSFLFTLTLTTLSNGAAYSLPSSLLSLLTQHTKTMLYWELIKPRNANNTCDVQSKILASCSSWSSSAQLYLFPSQTPHYSSISSMFLFPSPMPVCLGFWFRSRRRRKRSVSDESLTATAFPDSKGW